MFITSRTVSTAIASWLVLNCLVAVAMANWDLKYCSTQNTATNQAYSYDYQSNGECHDHCLQQGGSSFFVLQDKQCWCSDYIPADQRTISDCSETCPGFPSENCGKAGQYYIYVNLNGNPKGTAGASQPSSTQPSPAPTRFSTVHSPSVSSTVSSTVTSEQIDTPSPSSSSKAPSPSTSSTSASEPSSSADSPPPTQYRTVTEDNGNIKTVTLFQSASPTAHVEQPGLSGKNSSGSNTGAIVGGVVGGIGALALILGGVFFLLWRRRKQQRADEGGESGGAGVHRYASTMSKAGLLRTEKGPQYPAPIATSGFSTKRHSRALDQDSISPISASDRRNSSFRVDQRLNPSTLFVFDNTSRGSIGSLDDSRDYHRTLNVRNPDVND